MIVKVQIALNRTDAPALVYNEDRSHEIFISVNEALEKAMRGQPKAFFYAYAVHDELIIDLNREAPWQDW